MSKYRYYIHCNAYYIHDAYNVPSKTSLRRLVSGISKSFVWFLLIPFFVMSY